MRTYDFSPLYRSMVGFDRIADMLDQATRVDTMANWPPYNIEKLGDDQYRIVMAVAGFMPDEIELTQHENMLLIAGQKHTEPEGVQVLHRGIANRAFRQTFNLADYVKVSGANLENGQQAYDGYGFILVEFQFGKDLAEATQDLRDAISAKRADLPLEMEEPIIKKLRRVDLMGQ